MRQEEQAKLAQAVLALEYKYINMVEALQHIATGLVDSNVRLLHLVATYQESINAVEKILLQLAAREAAAD